MKRLLVGLVLIVMLLGSIQCYGWKATLVGDWLNSANFKIYHIRRHTNGYMFCKVEGEVVWDNVRYLGYDFIAGVHMYRAVVKTSKLKGIDFEMTIMMDYEGTQFQWVVDGIVGPIFYKLPFFIKKEVEWL